MSRARISTSSKAKPTVSIALACYNGERFLEEQLESLAAQSRLPTELVVCNDGSRDGTRRILESFAKGAAFSVVLIEHETNRGMREACAAALQATIGEVVFVCDQDDIWHRDKIDRYLHAFEDPDIAVVCSNSRIVDENRTDTGDTTWRRVRASGAVRHQLKGFATVLRHQFLSGHSLALRRTALGGVLPFPDEFTPDEWIGLLASSRGGLGLIEDCLCDYRLHASQSVGVGRESLLTKLIVQSERDETALALQVKRFEVARARLSSMNLGEARLREVDELVREKLAYLKARHAMRSAPWFGRWMMASRLLVRGSYHRVGRGLLALARDLTYRRPSSP